MSSIFITAASGHIGAELIPLLLRTSFARKLVLPTGNAARLSASIPKSDVVTIAEVSIQDPQWVQDQLVEHQVDAIFHCLTGTDELFTSMNLFSAMQKSGVIKHLAQFIS